MVTVPTLSRVITSPVEDTIAMSGLLLAPRHTVVRARLRINRRREGYSVCSCRGLGWQGVTVTLFTLERTRTLHVAVFPPSSVVTVMVASPTDSPNTLPLLLTLATAGSLDFQVTFWLVAFAGATVAVSSSMTSTAIVVEGLVERHARDRYGDRNLAGWRSSPRPRW